MQLTFWCQYLIANLKLRANVAKSIPNLIAIKIHYCLAQVLRQYVHPRKIMGNALGMCNLNSRHSKHRWGNCMLLGLFNSMAPVRSERNFENGTCNHPSWIGLFSSYHNALRSMPQDLTDDESTLVQTMAWFRQATSHYRSQFWPTFMTPFGVTSWQMVQTRLCLSICLWLYNRLLPGKCL